MGYLGDGLLGLNFGRFERIDPKYFGRLTWSGSKGMVEIGKYTGAPIWEQGDWP